MSVYIPRRVSTETRLQIRGIDYRMLHWGQRGAPLVLLLHGWMDCAATFQFMIDAAPAELLAFDVIAPDWRGFGHSGWAREGYWFPDYLADLDAMIGLLSPERPVSLVGHSMGGIVACLYAGIRPERVTSVVSMEGFGLPATSADMAPARYRRWLDEVSSGTPPGRAADVAKLAERLRGSNALLASDKAEWLALQLSITDDSGTRYRTDPTHRWVNPVLYQLEEAMACWRNVKAPVLWLAGDDAALLRWLKESPEGLQRRREAFASLSYTVVPGAGHNVHHDNPQFVAEEVARFLRRCTAANLPVPC